VPVVNHEGAVIDVLTDRDICIAAATRNRTPADIQVGELERGRVESCRPDDDLQTALGPMKQHRVRRLPVTDRGGALKGILSINDIVLAADTAKASVTSADVLDAFRVICARPGPARGSHTTTG